MLPLDVWLMILFSVLAFFGSSLWMLVYTLRQEDRKMQLLEEQEALDTHSPAALADLRNWIDAHPNDPDVDAARTAYRNCRDALHVTDQHFYDWSQAQIESLDDL